MLLRMELRDLLEAEGYDVVESGTAAQALERLGDAVSLMITDIRMPGGMDGIALAREVGRRRPDMAVVVVSAQVTPEPGDLPEGTPFVGRPVVESRLRSAIARAVATKAMG